MLLSVDVEVLFEPVVDDEVDDEPAVGDGTEVVGTGAVVAVLGEGAVVAGAGDGVTVAGLGVAFADPLVLVADPVE